MSSRFLIIIVSVGFLSLFAFIPDSDASRAIMSLEEMAERSDAIAIGTIQSTWIDMRPFDDRIIVDTAKVKVDKWLKNDKNENELDFCCEKLKKYVSSVNAWSGKIGTFCIVEKDMLITIDYCPFCSEKIEYISVE